MQSISYLNVREVHEVLGDVHHQLVHESRGYVETILGVVQAIPEANQQTIECEKIHTKK